MYLGRINYGFYAYHQFLPGLDNFTAAFDLEPGARASRLAWAAGSFAAAVLVSAASWYFVERLLLRSGVRQDKPHAA